MRSGRFVTNRLLDRLPSSQRASLIAQCEPVELALSDVLTESGTELDHAYFPTTGFVSLLTTVGENTLEVGLAGNEGMCGVPLAFGVSTSPVRLIVQGEGHAWRIGASAFRRYLARTPALRESVQRYACAMLAQAGQVAGCNRFHVVEQRLARWLLMTQDRAHASSFRMTHAFLASMLGVRRVGITEAAISLQGRGLIAYSRGVVGVLDREGLELAACDCYARDLGFYADAFA